MSRPTRQDVQQLNFDGLTDAVTNLVGALLLLVILVQGLARSAPAPSPTPTGSQQTRNVAVLLGSAETLHGELVQLDLAARGLLRQARELREQAGVLLGSAGLDEQPSIALAPLMADTRQPFQSLPTDRMHAQSLQAALDGLVVQLQELNGALAAFQPPIPEPQAADTEELRVRPPFEHAVSTQPMRFVCRLKRVAILPDGLSIRRALPHGMPLKQLEVIRPASGDFDLVWQTPLGMHTFVPKSDRPGEEWPACRATESRFMRWLGDTNPTQHHVEFYVYPDSFSLFRSLRQICWHAGYAVNWVPMASEQVLVWAPGAGSAPVVQ